MLSAGVYRTALAAPGCFKKIIQAIRGYSFIIYLLYSFSKGIQSTARKLDEMHAALFTSNNFFSESMRGVCLEFLHCIPRWLPRNELKRSVTLMPAALHTAHCTLHTAHCTLHTAHCTQHTEHCTLHTLHSTLHCRSVMTRHAVPHACM